MSRPWTTCAPRLLPRLLLPVPSRALLHLGSQVRARRAQTLAAYQRQGERPPLETRGMVRGHPQWSLLMFAAAKGSYGCVDVVRCLAVGRRLLSLHPGGQERLCQHGVFPTTAGGARASRCCMNCAAPTSCVRVENSNIRLSVLLLQAQHLPCSTPLWQAGAR